MIVFFFIACSLDMHIFIIAKQTHYFVIFLLYFVIFCFILLFFTLFCYFLHQISINLDTGIESCPCRIYNYCFSMFAYKSFVLFLAIFGVTLILATMVAAQRATKIPVKRSPKK
ncbi:hypothetical protein [Plasmodium yoelii yoelii]|uniref:Uncharacterized protein n=1 Tax=Plasmodium yoelii yoelii TaxID=73239 RepID=Q7RDP0_PLAYO|nr:hypothetical protein [Plasmodium yoelii yoelii]